MSMCGEQLSSTWETEKDNMDIGVPENQSYGSEKQRDNTKVQKEVVEEEFWQASCSGVVEEIYWVGGEPINV